MKTNPRKDDALITIKGIQTVAGSKDSTELTTTGNYIAENGCYLICYDESEATGFDGCHTVLKYEEGDNRVTLSRTGAVNTELIMEVGKRYQCSYDTGYGFLTIGVLCNKIEEKLNKKGGKLNFDYSLDINTMLTSENSISVHVKSIEQ